MSIYDNPQKYANETCTTLEQATIRCQYFKDLEKKTYEAKQCPNCGQYSLEIEGGSYEEGISDYVYCENDKVPTTGDDGVEYLNDCDFTSDVEKEYEALQHWYGFDIILMFALDIEKRGIKEVEKEIGYSWLDFVDKTTKKDCV